MIGPYKPGEYKNGLKAPPFIPELPKTEPNLNPPEIPMEKLYEEVARKIKFEEEGHSPCVEIPNYSGMFYIWHDPLKGYTRWWAKRTDCNTNTGCITYNPCSTDKDVHQEHIAWDYTYSRYVSVLFTAKCQGCCPGDYTLYAVPPNITQGIYYLTVKTLRFVCNPADPCYFCDCICQIWGCGTAKAQAVVLGNDLCP